MLNHIIGLSFYHDGKPIFLYPPLIMAILWIAYNIWRVQEISDELKSTYPQCTTSNPRRYWIFFGSMAIMCLTHYPLERFFSRVFDRIVSYEKFPRGSSQRESKIAMLGERAFRFINYTGRTPVLYYILLSSNFLDLLLGGNVERPLYFHAYPCQPLPEYLDDFYVFKISFHLYELGNTLVYGRERADFLEYALHHLMTWALIHFSYAMNYIPIGAAIMLIHDVTDIPVTTIKLIADINITSKYAELVVIIAMFTSWLYLRLWFFPCKIIYRMVEECYHLTVPGMNYSVLNMMLAFLCGLVCLHIFWFSLMIKAALRMTSKVPETRNQVMFKYLSNRID